MNKNNTAIADFILLALAVFIAVGTAFLFRACDAKEDGSFMSCHWAEHVVTGLGCVMTVISAAHLGAKTPRMKIGISIALLPVEIYTALVPGIIIKLCMMNTMRCHTMMRPCVTVICAIMVMVTVADIFIWNKKEVINNDK